VHFFTQLSRQKIVANFSGSDEKRFYKTVQSESVAFLMDLTENPDLRSLLTGTLRNLTMKPFLLVLLIFMATISRVFSQAQTPQQTLNQHVEFLNRSTEELTRRFQMIRSIETDVNAYRKKPDVPLRLPSSGPIEEYYFKTTIAGNGVNTSEKQQLMSGAKDIWQLLVQVDQTCKELETYIRLKSYQSDNLKQYDIYLSALQSLYIKFSKEKYGFYRQIQKIYDRYQPYSASNPYLSTQREMEQVILGQQQLLDSLPYYLAEDSKAEWPVERIQRSMLADEKLLAGFGGAKTKIAYPASDVIASFKSAIQSIQGVKRQALDDHNFVAKQSTRHGNEVYLSLLNYFNNDLLANYQSFVSYSQSATRLLSYPTFSPVFMREPQPVASQTNKKTSPFQEKTIPEFNIKRASAPAASVTIQVLNDYVGFINESLRQMHLLQMLVRNYQSSAEYYRSPSRTSNRANLSYSHADFKVPASAYQLLVSANVAIPQSYRGAVAAQAETLFNILQEMDGLSIELMSYTDEKQYLTDHLRRSDAILDRYLYLFQTFDQKKERLYTDIRRIHESYPNTNPTSSWYLAGNALLKTLDENHDVLFSVKKYLKGEISQVDNTTRMEEGAKQLIKDEYQNLKGLQRLGRSNGLCPYSPYEDIAENTAGFATMAQNVKITTSSNVRHPYESFYYFYNNQLVYQYNKFVELANAGLLKTINQPDVFAFRKLTPVPQSNPVDPNRQTVKNQTAEIPKSVNTDPQNSTASNRPAKKVSEKVPTAGIRHDTVYVERVRVDTVYVNQGGLREETVRSLDGFAANNMILLLDVSSSMDSPFKLPLLKRSIKSLLTLLRPEDQISIVVYSGKARVVLKPTSGAKAVEIGRMIDLLQSNGDTDGNEGLRLAYNLANKNYIRSGNNRIVLATDGEFPVSDEVQQMIGSNARQDINLSVFTFGKYQHTGQKLKKLSQLGKGTYAHVTAESADLQLILEAQAKKQAIK
jgi:Ca-activated chloride channel homolog